MKGKIPVLDSCTMTDGKGDNILVDELHSYLEKNRDMVFPHRHSFYHLVLFTGGSGTHSIDFNSFDVTPWQIYFMYPGQVHTWEFDEGTDGYIINFDIAFFVSFLLRADYISSFSFFSGTANRQSWEIPERIRSEVMDLFRKLYREVKGNGQRDYTRILLLSLFMLIDDCLEHTGLPGPQNHNTRILRSFQKLIEDHYLEVRLPKDYAELLFVTPNHLNGICKEFLGMQAGEVIRERVLLEAKRFLVSQNLTISEIAGELNFNDNSYFTKFFKKQTGLTPEEFRNHNIRK